MSHGIGRLGRVGIGIAAGIGAVAGIGWLGLQVEPPPFPPPAGQTRFDAHVPVPVNVPAPVARYYRAVFGDSVPVISSAVLTGRARLRLSGPSFPARLRIIHDAGRAYRHDIEATWFGWSILRVDESFVDGHARLVLPFGTIENEPKTDLAANLNLWAESFLLPSVFVTDRRARWEAIDAASARLIVPAGEQEDSLTVRFDDATGLASRIEAQRWQDPTDAQPTGWQVELRDWERFHGLQIATRVAITWENQGYTWFDLRVEDVAYNVDVSQAIRPTGQ